MVLLPFMGAYSSVAQLTTSTAQTPAQLVQNVLVGSGVVVSNVTYTGDPNAIGSFGGTSNIGLSSGILLTTGTVLGNLDGPIGPNNSAGAGTDNGRGGYPQLDAISGNTTHNAAILEFDFVPSSDSIKFRFVFGSEEYPEYVCGEYNDVFAFFITGPNPAGGSYSNQNIALIPGTTIPITINTINGGVAAPNLPNNFCTPFGLSNSSFYVDNTSGTSIEYDGFTVPIQAAAKVDCGETYHLKIAIADVGDGVWDSGIFLEANSFNSQVPYQMSNSLALNGFGDNVTMAEGCETATVKITRSANNANTALTLPISVGGTATEGVDFENLPNSITFNPGQTQVSFNFDIFSDAISEGIETVIIQISPLDPCGDPYIIELPLKIKDVQPVQAVVPDVSVHCPGEDAVLQAYATGGLPPYTYNWAVGGTNSSVSVNPTTTTSYSVTVNDACLQVPVTVSGTVNVPVYPPLIMVTSPDTTVLCPNTPQTLYAEATGGEGGFVYNWYENGVQIGSGTSQNVSPMVTTTYSVKVIDGCGLEIEEFVTVTVTASVLELEMSPDQLICPGDTANIWVNATEGLGNYTYYWTHNGDTTNNLFVNPNNTTSYTVSVEDACHTYSIQGVTTVKVIRPQANFNVLSTDPMENLLVSFQNTSVGGVTWDWDLGNGETSIKNSPTTVYNPWGWYTVTLIAYNEIGCADTVSKPIYIKPEFYFYAPNAFTPDGNRFNNTYGISVIGAIDFEFLIFNRWGELIYQTTDQNFGWDGSYNGILAPDGVYVYKAKVRDREYKVHDFKGMITLLR